jgi:hypothetical protein
LGSHPGAKAKEPIGALPRLPEEKERVKEKEKERVRGKAKGSFAPRVAAKVAVKVDPKVVSGITFELQLRKSTNQLL